MLYNHSAFPTIEKEHFLEGTRVQAALETVSSYYFKCEFRKNSRHVLEVHIHNILSNLAARSLIGQGLSCLIEIIIGGDDYFMCYLFEQLRDGFFEKKWIKGSVVEPSKEEFHSFMREHRQLE